MRSEHKTTGDEWDAFTKWRKFLFWKPGERKKIKQRSHQRDRRAMNKELREAVRDPRITGHDRLQLILDNPDEYFKFALEEAHEIIRESDEQKGQK